MGSTSKGRYFPFEDCFIPVSGVWHNDRWLVPHEFHLIQSTSDCWSSSTISHTSWICRSWVTNALLQRQLPTKHCQQTLTTKCYKNERFVATSCCWFSFQVLSYECQGLLYRFPCGLWWHFCMVSYSQRRKGIVMIPATCIFVGESWGGGIL